jgi:hypothetical protein
MYAPTVPQGIIDREDERLRKKNDKKLLVKFIEAALVSGMCPANAYDYDSIAMWCKVVAEYMINEINRSEE